MKSSQDYDRQIERLNRARLHASRILLVIGLALILYGAWPR